MPSDNSDKRLRSDAAEAATQHMHNAQQPPLQPPAHVNLDPSDMPFWNDVVCARARDTWTEVDLVLAANLARCLGDSERLMTQIRSEGDVIPNKKGTPVMNPKHALIEVLSRRAIAIMGKLQIHAAATSGDKRDTQAQTQAERMARQSLKQAAAPTEPVLGMPNDLIPTLANVTH